ncbi:MAG: ABC transporter ATP-binding protein [Firmicutes bacterium]|nr:ABC transporter ATP-binding protein [Bacillota bacterium]
MLCRLQNVTKAYEDITPIEDLDLSVEEQDYISVSGESGAGKSTLLLLAGGMLTPSRGEIFFDGRPYSAMNDNQISVMRSAHIGYISQSIQLLQALTVEENIRFAQQVCRRSGFANTNPAGVEEILARLGLTEKRDHLPRYLSGGQKRRAMIAVTWARNPRLYLLDEPTNDLDEYWAEQVMELCTDLHASGKALILVTHNPQYAQRAEKRYRLQGGKLVEDGRAL